MADRDTYNFSISYMVGNAYRSHEEQAECLTRDAAYTHFKKLLADYGVGGSSYYLCKWGRV